MGRGVTSRDDFGAAIHRCFTGNATCPASVQRIALPETDMDQTLFGDDDGGSWRDLAYPPAPLWPVALYAAGGSVSAVLVAMSSLDDVFPALVTLWLASTGLLVWIGW